MTTPCRTARGALTTTAAVLLTAHAAFAQTSVQIPLQLDFVNPGARSLAMGGAFAGLADDATAGFANPAGLRELGRPEFSIELRGRWLESSFLERGRLSGRASGEGTDLIDGPRFGTSRDDSARVPYASVVFPRARQGWVVAGFRHELARVDQRYFSEGVFQQDPAELTARRDVPQEGVRSIAITGYGVAMAWEITPRIAVGGTANLYGFDMTSVFRRFDVNGFFGEAIRSVELGRATQTGSDVAFAPTIGLRGCFKPCADRARASTRVGIVYRHGPSFDYDTQDGDAFRRNVFRLPHVVAGGVAVEVPRPGRRWLLTGEVKWVGYSRLFDDFIEDQALSTNVEDRLRIDNGVELHVGLQYAIETMRWIPQLRLGGWLDPDHSVAFIPGQPADHPALRLRDEKLAVALSTGRRRAHVSGGVGFTVSPDLEWNIGVDVAADTVILSTSAIFRFGA